MFVEKSFRFVESDRAGGASRWSFAMLREKASAAQLAEMIATKIGIAGLEIAVRKDHAYGWQPTVITAPSDPIGFQRRAEEIAHRLRVHYDLAY